MTAVPARTRMPGPQRFREMSSTMGWGVVAWVVGIAFFLPVLWMVITAFKPESAAETWPPRFTFSPTLAEFRLVFSGWGPYVTHSAIATIGSTILVLLLGVPAAYALSVHPVTRWRDGLFFFISTKMLPIVAAIGPLYVIALKAHLLDSIWLLIILYTAMNLPLAIWMIRSFMLEVPGEMLEAARLDGAGRIEGDHRGDPAGRLPGLVSTALICVIFAWNDSVPGAQPDHHQRPGSAHHGGGSMPGNRSPHAESHRADTKHTTGHHATTRARMSDPNVKIGPTET